MSGKRKEKGRELNCGKDIQVKMEGSVQSCREYELETGSKLREGKGGLVLIEQSEAIAQPQEAG